jgi:hypothetical protein
MEEDDSWELFYTTTVPSNQCCGTVILYYSSCSDFKQVTVPVPAAVPAPYPNINFFWLYNVDRSSISA